MRFSNDSRVKDEVRVRLAMGKALKLRPGHKYLLLFNRKHISADEGVRLGEMLKNIGVEGITVLVEGDPKTVQIVEAK